MARKMGDLSTETLLKRKRLAIGLIWLMIFAMLFTIAAGIYDYCTEEDFNITTLLGSLAACLAAALPLFLGLKKIREELSRRA